MILATADRTEEALHAPFCRRGFSSTGYGRSYRDYGVFEPIDRNRTLCGKVPCQDAAGKSRRACVGTEAVVAAPACRPFSVERIERGGV